MRYLALSIICRLFEIATKILVKPFAKEDQNRKMLTWFLDWDRTQRQHWIATFSFPLFGGIHPKNIFATRIEDLLATVEEFSANPLRVVDFGCGSGRVLEYLGPKVSSGLGIDLRAPPGGAHARISEKNPQIQFEYREHTPATLRGRIQAFHPDLVILSHVLEHIESPEEFLEAFHPFPLLVCLPTEESWLQRLREKLGLSTLSDSTHFREYTRDSVYREFELAGYLPREIHYNPEGEFVFIAVKKETPA